MQRRTYVAGIASALTAAVAGCSALGSDDGGSGSEDGDDDENDDGRDRNGGGDGALLNPSFEDDLTGWTVGKDLPTVPGQEEGLVDHGVRSVQRQAVDGESAVEFYISGIADDGTIWVEQSVDLTDVEAVAIDGYSRQASFNQISKVAFFAGEKPDRDLEEADFDRSVQAEGHEGWKTHSYDVTDVSGTVTVAFGISVVWETEVRRLFDNVVLVTADG